MTVTQLATDDVGANCETTGDTDIKFKAAYRNLTHVDYQVGIAAGLKAEVGLVYQKEIDILPFKAIPIATQCLAWHTEGGTTQLAPATAVLAAITAPPTPSGAANGGNGDKGKNAAGALRNPFNGASVQGILVITFCLVSAVALV